MARKPVAAERESNVTVAEEGALNFDTFRRGEAKQNLAKMRMRRV